VVSFVAIVCVSSAAGACSGSQASAALASGFCVRTRETAYSYCVRMALAPL